MRSRFGRRADAWPRDMVISVDPRPAALLELLYVREVRGLEVDAAGAWRSGVEKVFVLPSVRPYVNRFSVSVAAVSSGTRRDPAAYADALTAIADLAA